ncbi:hypothetical protein [Laspinema palackyanum]|uniref:hypothetical protein n=1 Tax=Laspinema palackyanum TaxID=3231601 RepID=UPI00345CA795|nr:hypothetical protein [Laspinema sp. D2c]
MGFFRETQPVPGLGLNGLIEGAIARLIALGDFVGDALKLERDSGCDRHFISVWVIITGL